MKVASVADGLLCRSLTESAQSPPPPSSDDYGTWTVDQLKLECTARKLAVAKNTNKADRVTILRGYDESQRFISSGDVSTRRELDEEGRQFWEEVAEGYNTINEDFDQLVSDDSLFEGIEPYQITTHSGAN
ncbi:hypothetical protein GQ600_21890 [Phytophthora cactorum]|nr:hypothetical protein GQ600_21890 [Phytophthora cactorum]